jgi:hypothetical protein
MHTSEPAPPPTRTRSNVTTGVQAAIDQAMKSAVMPLTEQIERLATENGRLAAENAVYS